MKMPTISFSFPSKIEKKRFLLALYECTGRHELQGWKITDPEQVVISNQDGTKKIHVISPKHWHIGDEVFLVYMDGTYGSVHVTDLFTIGEIIADNFNYNGVTCIFSCYVD